MPAKKKPNVLLILADDIGWFDVGAYHRGMMGAPTPNIDRIAREGVLLTDCYAQASCTAGRAAFITGQLPMRTGMTTVGLPGAPQGLRPEDPTLAELLKPEGYMTAQIGKNHLGDRNEYLPTGTRIRRVSRQSLSPQCGGRAGAGRLSQGPSGVPELLQAAWRAGL